MDYGKFKYSAQKKAAEARKKQKVVEIKEIKLRPMIDDHDYDVKMRAMQRFFEEGDKVKITLRYRGREMAHQEIGTKLLDKVKSRRRGARQGRAGRQIRGPSGRDGAGAALVRVDQPSKRARQLDLAGYLLLASAALRGLRASAPGRLPAAAAGAGRSAPAPAARAGVARRACRYRWRRTRPARRFTVTPPPPLTMPEMLALPLEVTRPPAISNREAVALVAAAGLGDDQHGPSTVKAGGTGLARTGKGHRGQQRGAQRGYLVTRKRTLRLDLSRRP